MNNEILVFSETQSCRSEYIFSYILCDLLGLKPIISADMDEVLSATGPIIFYSEKSVPERLCIRPSGLLSETSINPRTPATGRWGDLKTLFPDSHESAVPFDIFSASFWMISRYEEYLPFKPDIYGRFPAEQSLAFQSEFLNVPVVNLWANQLAEVLQGFYPLIKIKKPGFNWLATIDADMPWAYLNHSIYKTLGGLASAFLRGRDTKNRIKILRGQLPDPYFCFDEIRSIHKDFPEKLLLFFPCGIPGKFDLNIHPDNKEWRKLVTEISGEFQVGLHPSFRSHSSESTLKKEFETLSDLVSYPLKNSRQHFLKMQFPGTFRSLIQLGIENDYSMGYPGMAGFRAGVSTPFYFFDLERNEKTSLRVWPLTLMDRTLKDYMHKTPGESGENILKIIRVIEKAGGWFIPVWHNDSLSDFGEWRGWKNVYVNMIEILKTMP